MQLAPHHTSDQQVGQLIAATSPFAVSPTGFLGVATAQCVLGIVNIKWKPSISSSLIMLEKHGISVFSPHICMFIVGSSLFMQTTKAQHSSISALFL